LSAECASENCENRSIIGEDMDKSKVPRFLAHPVEPIYGKVGKVMYGTSPPSYQNTLLGMGKHWLPGRQVGTWGAVQN